MPRSPESQPEDRLPLRFSVDFERVPGGWDVRSGKACVTTRGMGPVEGSVLTSFVKMLSALAAKHVQPPRQPSVGAGSSPDASGKGSGP